jgi:small GTP-binding protein
MFTRKNVSDNTFKVVTLGSSGVGKTSLMVRYVKETFTLDEASTIGASFLKKKEGESVVFEIFDTAGQERYESLAPLYYRSAQVAIIIYDITNRETWNRAKRWFHTIENMPILIVILGNKVDIGEESREVSTKELHDFVRNTKHLAYETSALLNVSKKESINSNQDVKDVNDVNDFIDGNLGVDAVAAVAAVDAVDAVAAVAGDVFINRASIDTIFLEIAQKLLDQKLDSDSKQIVAVQRQTDKKLFSGCSLL